MRNIARAVDITPAALYHHFPDKQSLYFAAMSHAFAEKADAIDGALSNPGPPAERLKHFIEGFAKLIGEDPNFRSLLQRELLDGDEARLKSLAEQVFERPYRAVADLARELAPDCDPHLLTISMGGLVLFHFELMPLRHYLPDRRAEHDDPDVVAQHVIKLLFRALGLEE